MCITKRNSSQATYEEKEMDYFEYNRPKPKCGVIFCIALVATLFFLIGLMQTFLAICYVEESSKRPILVMGPMFAGVGIILYFVLIEMCIAKYRRRKRVTNTRETPVSDALAEAEKPAYAARPRSMMTLQLNTYQLPAFLTLTNEDLKKMGPEQKEQLLGGPLLMPPVAETNTIVPLTFKGNLPDPCVPPVVTYNPPPEALIEESELKKDEGKTEDTSSELPEKIIQVKSETAAEVRSSGCRIIQGNENESDTNDDDLCSRNVSKATMTEEASTPIKRGSKIPEEIFEMLGKVEEVYKASSETSLKPNDLE